MTKGIGIVFTAQNDQVVQAGREIEDSLDDVAERLDDVKDNSEDSTRAIEDLGDAGRDAGDDLVDASEESADALGEVTDTAGKVGDAIGDVGGIAKSALEGDLAGAAEGGLDALSGLAAAIPGIGAIIGTIFAEVGKGVIDMWQERAAESEARIKEMYQDFAESGSEYLSGQYIQTAADAILGDPVKYQEAKDLAASTGLAISTVIQGLAGDTEARDTLEAAIIAKMQEQRDLAEEMRGDKGYLLNSAELEARALQEQLDKLNASNGERDIALEKGQLLYDIQQEQTAEAQRTNDALGEPISKQVVLEVDSSRLDAVLRQQRYANVEVQFTRNGVPVY